MKILRVELKNCYGIRYFNHEFDFQNHPVYAIYAPNGIMKTSFAKTFMDMSKGDSSKDLIFPDRETKRIICKDNNIQIDKNEIFVIEPYNRKYTSEKTSTLLVNQVLKNKYDIILKEIETKKKRLIKQLKEYSGLARKTEGCFSEDFVHIKNGFFRSLLRIKDEVKSDNFLYLATIKYSKVFTPKVLAFLSKDEVKNQLRDYLDKYNALIESSTYFRKGVFNHNNAATIAKNLQDNGFFEANHALNLLGDNSWVKVDSLEDLEKIISDEKEAILNNEDLKSSFEKIDRKLNSNKELKAFRDYLLDNLILLSELDNLPLLREKLWLSYIQKSRVEYDDLITEYEKGREEIDKIVQKARAEETTWKKVVNIFNSRFVVPFRVSVENQEDVILNQDAPKIQFSFRDSQGRKIVQENQLFDVLSNGELRALYILNLIFEIEARREGLVDTLFIIDDIADSFDYKNKYAIIEYLKDMAKEDYFKQIILSHNFDFFRTVSRRLLLDRACKLNTVKNANEVKLIEEKYQNNPFTYWKKNFKRNTTMLIAAIPFVRNIAEYSGDNTNFIKLTSLLHIKDDTKNITISDIERIFKEILKDVGSLSLPNPNQNVLDMIYEEANSIVLQADEIIELEHKIVLAIAIRLKCEEFLITKINDDNFVKEIRKNQTRVLSDKYIQIPNSDKFVIKLIESVNLMTPENIHLNSFMYEPILDMSNDSLKRLYASISNVN